MQKKKGQNTTIVNKQVPISFSFGTNFSDEIQHFVNNDTNALINSLTKCMYDAYDEATTKVMNEYSDFIKHYCINKLKMGISKDEPDLILIKDGKEIRLKFETDKNKFKNQRDVNQIKKWLQFPVIGFNNSFYDINICKDYDFIKAFNPTFAIKQGSRYKSLANDKICILDQMMYCPAGTSLDKYLKSRETDMKKGHFPYRWLTSYDKLTCDDLPEYKFFESSKTTPEEYESIKGVWKSENIVNMFDYLKYYNNLDVKPLIQAITKHKKFYYDIGFDMHKDAISLSGLAEKIMFKNSHEQEYENTHFHTEHVFDEDGNNQESVKVYDNKVYLINEMNKECFYKLKNNCVGGPSIVFHRYHEKDVTRISRAIRRNGKYELIEDGKLISKIVGYDANALYLWSLSQQMPTSTLRYEAFTDDKDINELLKNTFGFYEVDIQVPDDDDSYNKFLEFPPIFRNCTLKDGSRKLISCMSTKNILIYHPLLNWYLEHGLVVTKVHGMIHSKCCKIFKSFGELVSDERRKGDMKSIRLLVKK